VSHRLVEVLARPGGDFFRTKGDANATADAYPVPSTAVRGRVVWSVPKLGWLLMQLQWPRGFLLLVAVPASLLLVSELRHRRWGRSTNGIAERTIVPRASGAGA